MKSVYVALSIAAISVFVASIVFAAKPEKERTMVEIIKDVGETRGKFLVCKREDYVKELKYFESLVKQNPSHWAEYEFASLNSLKSYKCNKKDMKALFNKSKDDINKISHILFQINAKKNKVYYI